MPHRRPKPPTDSQGAQGVQHLLRAREEGKHLGSEWVTTGRISTGHFGDPTFLQKYADS